MLNLQGLEAGQRKMRKFLSLVNIEKRKWRQSAFVMMTERVNPKLTKLNQFVFKEPEKIMTNSLAPVFFG